MLQFDAVLESWIATERAPYRREGVAVLINNIMNIVNAVLEFAKLVLPVFQIMQAILIPFLFYKVWQIHKKRLQIIIEREKEEKII